MAIDSVFKGVRDGPINFNTGRRKFKNEISKGVI